MNKRLLPAMASLCVGLLLTSGCLCAKGDPEPIPVSAATTPSERLGAGWWKARLEMQEAKAKTQHDTVFIGDSITHNWDNIAPDLQKQYFGDVLNLGISGDKTQEVLWRIARIDWKVVAPKRIMLMIGTNNSGHGAGEKPENTFNGIKAIVRYLRAACPEADVSAQQDLLVRCSALLAEAKKAAKQGSKFLADLDADAEASGAGNVPAAPAPERARENRSPRQGKKGAQRAAGLSLRLFAGDRIPKTGRERAALCLFFPFFPAQVARAQLAAGAADVRADGAAQRGGQPALLQQAEKAIGVLFGHAREMPLFDLV